MTTGERVAELLGIAFIVLAIIVLAIYAERLAGEYVERRCRCACLEQPAPVVTPDPRVFNPGRKP